MTARMTCSISRMVRPLAALSSRRKATITSISVGPQTRHHLVEQQQLGLGRERARHLEPLAVGQGQALGELMRGWSQGRAVSGWPRRLRGPSASVGSAVQRAHRDILEHAQALERLHDLEGPADAGGAHAIRRAAREICRPSSVTVPASGAKTPAIMLKIVVLPAPFGPISAIDRAGRHHETDIVHRAQAAEALADTGELEAGAAHRRRSPKPSRSAIHGQIPAGPEHDDDQQSEAVEDLLDAGDVQGAAQHR